MACFQSFIVHHMNENSAGYLNAAYDKVFPVFEYSSQCRRSRPNLDLVFKLYAPLPHHPDEGLMKEKHLPLSM